MKEKFKDEFTQMGEKEFRTTFKDIFDLDPSLTAGELPPSAFDLELMTGTEEFWTMLRAAEFSVDETDSTF